MIDASSMAVSDNLKRCDDIAAAMGAAAAATSRTEFQKSIQHKNQLTMTIFDLLFYLPSMPCRGHHRLHP